MPAYNHEKFIAETINSVLNQSYSNIELVIIDDGSKDKTAEIIKSFDDPRLVYHYQENQDAYNAINNGLAKATGEYLAIINSDDVFMKERIQRCMDMVNEKSALCVITEVELINDDSEIIDNENHFWRHWHNKNKSFYEKYGDLYTTFLNGNVMVTTSNLFMHKSVYQKIGGFSDYRYLHDYDYIFRILEHFEENTCYLDSEKLIQYRLHNSNTISQAAITGREQDREIIRKAIMTKFQGSAQKYLEVGINRLITLEHELVQVHKELEQTKLDKEAYEKSQPKTRLDFYKIHLCNAIDKVKNLIKSKAQS